MYGGDKHTYIDANMATHTQINIHMKSDSQQTFNLSSLSQVRCWQRHEYLTKTHIGPGERDKLFVSAVNAANLVSHHFKFKSTAAQRGSEKMCVHETRGDEERDRERGKRERRAREQKEEGERTAEEEKQNSEGCSVREGERVDKIT